MGKRSDRFSGKKLLSNVHKLAGKEVQIVLWEGATYFGDLIETKDHEVTIRDKNARWYNQKAHTHTLSLENIREIIMDKASKW